MKGKNRKFLDRYNKIWGKQKFDIFYPKPFKNPKFLSSSKLFELRVSSFLCTLLLDTHQMEF